MRIIERHSVVVMTKLFVGSPKSSFGNRVLYGFSTSNVVIERILKQIPRRIKSNTQ